MTQIDRVPERYRGVWKRTLLETPTLRDDTSIVLWMQTDLWHADVRIPWPAQVARPQAPLSSLSGPQRDLLATQSGFGGTTQIEPRDQGQEVCTWHRHADYQPPGTTPDAGWMVFETPDRVIETGVHGVYREVWERLPDSIGLVLSLVEPGQPDLARAARILVAGRYLMRVRPRLVDWPQSTPLGATLGEVLNSHPDLAFSLLDFEVSFATLDEQGWTIQHSTLPELEGTRLAIDPNWLPA
jgi:hypothetical protein